LILFALLIVVYGDPLPPEPSQYTLQLFLTPFAPRGDQLYVDLLKAKKDRIDIPRGSSNYTLINDIELGRSYTIYAGRCEWKPFERSYVPFLYFPFRKFLGTEDCWQWPHTNNTQLCNQWKGCHPFENPPAPFYLQATQSSNVPVYLDFPSLHNTTLYFKNYNIGAPNSDIFNLPSNCTKADHHSQEVAHSMLELILLHSNIGKLTNRPFGKISMVC